MHPIIALWAHQRARSTAFLRMMIAREDVTVIHEPLVTLFDEGEVFVPEVGGGKTAIHSEKDLFLQLRRLAEERTVFFKDTVEYRYGYLFKHPEAVKDFIHTFIVRDPKPTINSLCNMKPTFSRPEVGYEHQFEILELAEHHLEHAPVVIDSDKLVQDSGKYTELYCQKVGLPFLPEALNWSPEKRPEWHRTQRWHEDVSTSSGFTKITNEYEKTVANTPKLQHFYQYHLPFYRELVSRAY